MEISYSLRATLTLTTGYAFALTGADIVGFTLREGVRGGGMLPGAAPAAWGRLTLLDRDGAWRPGGSRLGSRTLFGATALVELDAGGGYAPAGCFIVSRVEAREGESQIALSGYDNMAHALAAPFTDSLEYPQTLGNILAHIVGQTGLVLWGSPACNAGVSIARRPDWGEGCTLRRALGWTAGAMGCFVRFDRGGLLTLTPAWPGGTPQSLLPSQAMRLSVCENDFALERVRILPRSAHEAEPVEAAVSGAADASAANTLELGDNALFRPGAPELQALADGLLSALSGMALTPFDGEFFTLDAPNPGDRVRVYDLGGAAHESQVFSLSLELEGAPGLLLACDPETGGVSLPASLSASGLLSGGALSEGMVTARHLAAGSVDSEKLAARSVTAEKLAAGAVTAEKLAAGAVSADAITSGKLSTDRLIIGGTEFSIVRALNQLAQTIVAGDARLSGAVLADGTISAAKVTDDFGTGLELSSNAAILLLAGLLDGTHSHLELTQDAINMVGGEINIATDELQISGMEGGQEILSLTPADGLSTTRVVARSVYAQNVVQVAEAAAIPWQGSIQGSLDAWPRMLLQAATLTIPAGAYSEDVEIAGFLGERLTLDFSAGVELTGSLRVSGCSSVRLYASARNLGLVRAAGAENAITVEATRAFRADNMNISGYAGRTTAANGSDYGVWAEGSNITLAGCCVEYTGVACVGLSCGCGGVSACIGGASGSDPTTCANLGYGVSCESGAHAGCSGTTFLTVGASAHTDAGTVAAQGTLTPTAGHYASGAAPDSITTFTVQAHCQYVMAQSASTSGTSVSQGRNGAYSSGRSGWRMGCLWFDLSSLSGCTITGATLRIRRASAGYSPSDGVAVKVFAYACAYANRGNYSTPEDHLSQTYASGNVLKETELTLDVTSLIDAGFISGGYALALYEPRASYNSGQTHSNNYANFYSLGSAYEPTLTVTYQLP